MRSKGLKLCTLAVVATLVVAVGCSRGSDDDAGSDAGSATSAPAPDVTIAPAKDFALPAPVKLVALISDPTISADPNAISDYNDGARMAVEQINAAGGLGGHPVELVALETPPTGDGAVNSFNRALQEGPTAILGPVSSSAALALAPRVAEARVPVLQNTTDPQLSAAGGAGNEWMFATRPLNSASADIAGRFAVEELGAQDVGLMYVTAAFGQQGATGVKAGVAEAGGQVTAERSFEFNATELTEPALAMAGVQAIVDWGTPNTLALSVVTLNQQGLGSIPQIGPGSTGFASFVASVGDPSLLDDVYGTLDCNPADSGRPVTQQFRSDFLAEYGYEPSYASAELYDSVFMVRNIVEAAESAEAAVIRDGLAALDWDGGVCEDRYVNRDNVLVHQAVMARFEDGRLVTVRQYDDL